MACFLACFRFSKKQKHRRPANWVLFGDQIYASYEYLHNSPNADLSIFKCPVATYFRDEPKKQPRQKVRKKVSFNLNVQTYEPTPDEYFLSDSEKEIQDDKSRKETTTQNVARLELKSSSLLIYPLNHRYQNSSYDEDDDISLQESDSDGIDHSQTENCDKEFATRSSDDGKLPHRSQCEYSVLKPIENLTQWKTAKAKTVVPKRRIEKDEVPSSNPRSSVRLKEEIKAGANAWKIE